MKYIESSDDQLFNETLSCNEEMPTRENFDRDQKISSLRNETKVSKEINKATKEHVSRLHLRVLRSSTGALASNFETIEESSAEITNELRNKSVSELQRVKSKLTDETKYINATVNAKELTEKLTPMEIENPELKKTLTGSKFQQKEKKVIREHKCTICSKILSSKYNLSRHFRGMHGSDEDKPFACEICQKRFVQKSHLKICRHKRKFE